MVIYLTRPYAVVLYNYVTGFPSVL